MWHQLYCEEVHELNYFLIPAEQYLFRASDYGLMKIDSRGQVVQFY
ncbi:hypothetical protein SOVF_169450 [Spinacia oleracea]|nr:hypothetical protein SOVF_169450 [Spinacia oleracea]